MMKLSINPATAREGDKIVRKKGRTIVQFTVTRVITTGDLCSSTATEIDPVGCGCTDCLTGKTRPAIDYEEYEIAKSVGLAR